MNQFIKNTVIASVIIAIIIALQLNDNLSLLATVEWWRL
ncbi:hypothetical protein Sp14A_00840 [Streptococcus pluranimalium]|uniref:Uncharacterized protein n=1 Tax=Streptococcus pluranimalium TaxID=82348 RepID=A0A345VH55_9STRE|nr:hypothetical protein Sp14A_00840 [Streptococcus pluranimalium]